MLRKTVLGVVAVLSLMVISTGTASAHGGYHGGFHGGGYHGGYGGHRGGFGYRGGYVGGYRGGFLPPVYAAPPVVYGYPPVAGYGYGAQPSCGSGYSGGGYGGGGYGGGGYGYAQPSVGVSTPGFGFYVR